VVIQLTIVDRIAFPGGGPNLVLLLVAALALAGGPMAGVLTGFFAGLALDVAPPGSHFTGQSALVFCLIGYACGLLSDDFSGDAEQGHTALFEIVVTAAGAVCGEALVALLGVMLSDPRVSWPAITNVLPATVAYDVLLCPFVLYAAAASLRLAGVRREDPRPGFSASQTRASQARSQLPAASQGAIRQLAGGGGPRLRLSERPLGSGSAGALRGPGASRPVARREPQLKLGRPAARPSAAFVPGGLAAGSVRVKLGGGRVKWGGRRRQGVLGGSLLGGASLGGASLSGASMGGSRLAGPGARFGRSSMGRSLLGGSVFSRSSSPLASGSVFGRSAPLGRSSPLRHRANLMRSASGGLTRGGLTRSGLTRGGLSRGGLARGRLTRRVPRLSRGGTPKSPGRNWLRGASSRGTFTRQKGLSSKGLSSKSLTSKRLGRKAFGRSRMSRPRVPRLSAKRRWGRRGGYL
ncbi:MAG TPA: rod shape-determining protein MreD, partial [Streptosporangiaceae bacterium]|nr:rod shape-determining protein MreD [Streptosporangiaceae bacterium]